MSTPLLALYGRNAKLIYGTILELEVDTYKFDIDAPVVDTTNISVYSTATRQPYWLARLNSLIPVMAPLTGDPRRYMEFGAPQQVTFGGIRRGVISMTGLCHAESSTPHIGNYARVLLTHAAALGVDGYISATIIVSKFSIEQSVGGYMKWSATGDSTGEFDVTQQG